MRLLLVPALAALMAAACADGRADLVFTENGGNPASNTAVNSYTGWSNGIGLSFSGSPTTDVRTSVPSTGYTGATGDGNVLMNDGEFFQIGGAGGINTSAYTTTFTLSFGAYKTTNASTMSELTLEYSADGTTYTLIGIPAQPTGMGTASWRLIKLENITLASVANLRLRFTHTGGTVDFRLDDFALTGVLSIVPEAPSLALAALAACTAGTAAWLGRRRSASG